MSDSALVGLQTGQNLPHNPYHEAAIAIAPPFRLRPTAGRLADVSAKRLFDVIVAILLLVFTAPLMLVLLVLVRMDGEVGIFTHRRIGRGGREFGCLKFRSMYVDADVRLEHLLNTDAVARAEWARDHKLRNDPRVTPLGRFMRASSLDELPQLVNIIQGDMSIVGPRPIVRDEARRYGRRIQHYLQTRPGLTGLWQVSGRNDVTYRRRVAMDTLYAKQRSFMLDMKIVLMTVPAVLKARGSY